jgi:hypothetical protein
MSKLTETKRAFEKISGLLDQEIRKSGGNVKELERFRETLKVAFYLLGWGQFEYLVRTKTKEVIEEHARSKTVDGHAWRSLQQNVKGVKVRKQLDIIFHGNQRLRDSLDDDYDVRNDAAHNYKNLPADAQDIEAWLVSLEEIISQF